jgi:hypothetical protein
VTVPEAAPPRGDRRDADPDGWHFDSTVVLTLLLLVLGALQGPIRKTLSAPVMQSWLTVFVGQGERHPGGRVKPPFSNSYKKHTAPPPYGIPFRCYRATDSVVCP